MSSRNNYLELLESAWQDHLAERESNASTVISLFAGAGGSSLGYNMAGYRELLAVEWNSNAVKTFNLNFPDVPVYHGDIHDLTIDQAMELSGLSGPGELDVLDGSPPCQGFSTAGKRQMFDPRNELYMEYVRLLRGLRPKIMIMENVSGLVKGKMKLIFSDIMKRLKDSGYRVRCKLLDAQYLNVPQRRRRLIWIGAREDLEIEPTFPGPQNKPTIVEDAFRGLGEYEDRSLPEFIKEYAEIHPGGWNTHRGFYKSIKGNTASSISLKWASWNRTCGTLMKAEIADTGIVHPNRHRYLNLSEAKRIASFPDDYKFLDREMGWMQIGNSVPPLMMRAIAEHVQDELLASLDCRLAE